MTAFRQQASQTLRRQQLLHPLLPLPIPICLSCSVMILIVTVRASTAQRLNLHPTPMVRPLSTHSRQVALSMSAVLTSVGQPLLTAALRGIMASYPAQQNSWVVITTVL